MGKPWTREDWDAWRAKRKDPARVWVGWVSEDGTEIVLINATQEYPVSAVGNVMDARWFLADATRAEAVAEWQKSIAEATRKGRSLGWKREEPTLFDGAVGGGH